MRSRVVLVLFVGGLLAALAAGPAQAARPAKGGERMALLRAAAASPGGELDRLRIRRGGRLTMAPLSYDSPATALTVRSSVSRSWALVVAALKSRADIRRTFLLQRRSGRWRVLWSANRGDEAVELCRRTTPGTAVALDLGLASHPWGGRCRHPRNRKRLIRAMTASELASVRAMVEWRYNDSYEWVPGPVQPTRSEVLTSQCAWDGRGQAAPPAEGEVARANARWGVAIVTCAIGFDGFGYLESPTLILVSRSGRTGPFTAVPAHTLPSWTSRGSICTQHRWRVPAAPRVALEFCTPFPSAIRDGLR